MLMNDVKSLQNRAHRAVFLSAGHKKSDERTRGPCLSRLTDGTLARRGWTQIRSMAALNSEEKEVLVTGFSKTAVAF